MVTSDWSKSFTGFKVHRKYEDPPLPAPLISQSELEGSYRVDRKWNIKTLEDEIIIQVFDFLHDLIRYACLHKTYTVSVTPATETVGFVVQNHL